MGDIWQAIIGVKVPNSSNIASIQHLKSTQALTGVSELWVPSKIYLLDKISRSLGLPEWVCSTGFQKKAKGLLKRMDEKRHFFVYQKNRVTWVKTCDVFTLALEVECDQAF